MNRFFTQHALTPGATVSLEASIQKHAVQVLRLKAGAQLELVGPNHLAFTAQITQPDPLVVQVQMPVTRVSELPIAVRLICGIPKGEKAEWIVQKGTELGARHISFFNSQWATAKWPPAKVAKKLKRLAAIAQGAAEQSHRCFVPVVDVVTLTEMTHLTAAAKLVAYEESGKAGEAAALVQAVRSRPQTLIAVFGPEGGLSPTEVATLTAHGYVAAGLGPRILRTETAPLYLLSAVSALTELQGESV